MPVLRRIAPLTRAAGSTLSLTPSPSPTSPSPSPSPRPAKYSPSPRTIRLAHRAKMSTSSTTYGPTFESVGIKNRQIETAPGVQLSDQKKVLVGSVLDLFEGHPTLKHLALWSRSATFSDPITIAEGFDRFAAQWYGLPAVFRPIQIQSHTVTDAGNPLALKLKNKYVVKGIGKEQTVESTVKIWTGQDGRIDKVEDRWNGKLPDGAVSEVSAAVRWAKGRMGGGGGSKEGTDGKQGGGGLLARTVFLPVDASLWAVDTAAEWAFTGFCTAAWWWPFWAFRKLNAVTVPTLVRVPKDEQEDNQMKQEREAQR